MYMLADVFHADNLLNLTLAVLKRRLFRAAASTRVLVAFYLRLQISISGCRCLAVN